MADENKHMDDAFKRMSEEFNVPYNPAFWNEAQAKLDDDSLDDAFRTAAANVVVGPVFEAPAEGVDDMFMDSAFVDAAAEQTAAYDPSMFEQFLANEGDLLMDEAFNGAAAASVATYQPEYWNDADQALKNEGLHYEYSESYWLEAKKLLDKQDRGVFFAKWTGAAIILLLLSFGTNFIGSNGIDEISGMASNQIGSEDYLSNTSVAFNELAEENRENLLSTRDFREDDFQMNDADGVDHNVNHSDFADANHGVGIHNGDVVESRHINDGEIVDGAIDRDIDNGMNNGSVDITEIGELKIEKSMLELNKMPNEFTFPANRRMDSPSIQQIGYNRSFPEIQIDIKERLEPIHKIGLIAEGGFGNRWGQFNFVPTLRSGFGVEYMARPAWYSDSKLKDFEFGANFKVNHIRQPNLSYKQSSFNADIHSVTNTDLTVYLTDMVSANINALVNYRFAPAHKIKFGIGAEYLVGARSNSFLSRTTQNIGHSNNATNENLILNKNWGSNEGINRFDLRFTVGYELEVSERLSVQANTYFGMFDRTDNQVFDTEEAIGVRDSEISIMVGVKYDIFKRPNFKR